MKRTISLTPEEKKLLTTKQALRIGNKLLRQLQDAIDASKNLDDKVDKLHTTLKGAILMCGSFDKMLDSLSISHPFEYPNEKSEEITEIQRMSEVLQRLSLYLLSEKDPRSTLVAMLYCAGVDISYILGCDNTETAIAKKLSISKQKMSLLVKRVSVELNLKSLREDLGKTPSAYANNHKKVKVK